MCILCVIQKWSRKVATMLPWLVIPLIGLWLLSQFLPPAFRFEITSPRLACVLVLLATLFWYEILMPQLSSWRARRNARLNEKKRLEAIEMKKLRKTATRRCRNCKTPYRDQNPSGGKFMCSYCGHASKRPLFDPSVSSGLEQSGVLKDFVGKVWPDNNWICGQDWIENGGYWVNGSLSGKSSYVKKNNGGFFNSGNDHFFSFLIVFVCKSLAAIVFVIIWPFRKLFRISFSEDEDSSDTDVNGLSKKGENGVNCNETKSEKARRKAEEKRQARLEKEQLEEEERKQREEVARLVEERRKLRDEFDKKTKALTRDKNDKNEAEIKRQERRKDKDRGSSKSNSDVDELEKRVSKEIERNLKGDVDSRDHHKPTAVMTNNYKGSVGARYLDRMRGNFFQSSRTITGGFFGKGVNAKANALNTREHKSSAYLDHANKRDFVHPERAHGKSNAHADDQSQNRSVVFESQPYPPPKRSWHQLFTRSSPPASSTSTNVICRPDPSENLQTESQSSIAFSGYPVTQGFDNPISYGLPFPISYVDSTSNKDLHFSAERVHREPEIYEDPCFVADPVSLIGPASDSFDNFPIDLGFLADVGTCERHTDSFISSRTPEKTKLPVEDHVVANNKGWQMWDNSFSPDTLGLVTGNPNWCSPQKTTTNNDPWALRTSYGPISSTNNRLSMDLQENKLVYGIPNGSTFNHPFQPSNGGVWAKKDKTGPPVCVEGITSTSGLIAPGDGPYSTPLQMYSPFGHMNEKEKEGYYLETKEY